MKIDMIELYENANIILNNSIRKEDGLDYAYTRGIEDSLKIIKELFSLDKDTLKEILNCTIDDIINSIRESDMIDIKFINDKIEEYKSKIRVFKQFDEIYDSTTKLKGIVTNADYRINSVTTINILLEDYRVKAYGYIANKYGKIDDKYNNLKFTGKHYGCIEEFLKVRG